MGDVILVYKVLPADPAGLAKVKKALEAIGAKRIEEEPIGFGIVSLKVTAIVPDESGVQDAFEEKLGSVKGVQSFELLAYSRSL